MSSSSHSSKPVRLWYRSIMTELGAGPGPRSLGGSLQGPCAASGLSARFRRKDTLQTLLNPGTASVPTFCPFTTGFPHSAVQAARKASPFAPRPFSRVLAGTTGSATLDLVPLGSNPTREILPIQPHYPARYPCAAAARRPLDFGTTPPGLASCEL